VIIIFFSFKVGLVIPSLIIELGHAAQQDPIVMGPASQQNPIELGHASH